MAVTIAIVGAGGDDLGGHRCGGPVVAPVVKNHGLDYLIATVPLAGAFQILLSALGPRLMRFIPRSVMVGFVNPGDPHLHRATSHLVGVPWLVYPMVAAGLVIIVGLPRLTTVVPAPLVAIVLLSGHPRRRVIGAPMSVTRANYPTAFPLVVP